MRHSRIYELLPPEVRKELDDKLLVEHWTQLECVGWLERKGYPIAKSTLNRYAQKLFAGIEDLKKLSLSGQTLARATADVIATADPALAEIIQDLVTLQVRQLALLEKLRDHLRDRNRDEAAAEWLQAQRQTEAL